MTTKDIENLMYKQFSKTGLYSVFECAVPRSYTNKYHRERVDYVSYETNGTFRFYEIKLTASDFRSGCAWTFLGHYNYFVMPHEVYIKVKDEIPEHVGVWAVKEYYPESKSIYKRYHLDCVKKPKKQELKVNKDDMLFAMFQALSREYVKYRKKLEKDNK